LSNSPKLRKKTLGSYPYFSVIFSVTLALYVVGLFSLLLIDAKKLSKIIKENFAVYIYFNQESTQLDRDAMKAYLDIQHFVAKKNGIADVTFISKEEAAKEFIKETGEDFHQLLGINPLRDAYEVKIAQEFSSEKHLKAIRKLIGSKPGVYEVHYKENMIDIINENLHLIEMIFISFASLLIFAVVLLMNNTIKLAMYSQRFLIRSMQLVGATGWFIQGPFIWRSILKGFFAGVIADVLLSVTLQFSHDNFVELKMLYDPQNSFIVFSVLPFIGAFVCAVNTIFAIRRYLRMSLDNLY